jgi:transcriptional regulator with XRE-family HTH domain
MAMRDEKKFLARRLRELREQGGLTQEKFAEKAGFNYKIYQSFEASRRWNLELKTLIRLASEHGLSLSEFFADKTPRSQSGRAQR